MEKNISLTVILEKIARKHTQPMDMNASLQQEVKKICWMRMRHVFIKNNGDVVTDKIQNLGIM